MGTTHEGTVRVRGSRFFDIGVVGRRTGITVKPNVKKDADGLDNIDDFWDDGNDTSFAPAPLKDQIQRQERHPHPAQSFHANNLPVVEAQELELSRRLRPPRANEYIGPEFVDGVLHDISEELLSTPASRRSRSGLNSTASDPVYTSVRDRPQAQGLSDFELADSGSVSGPDEIADEGDQEDDDSPQLPETPSRASHSILVSATPVHLRGPPIIAPSSKSRATPEEALLEEEDHHKAPPVPAAYQFSDEEVPRDHGFGEDTASIGRERNRRAALPAKERVAELSVCEREISGPSNSEDDAPQKRRTIRPRRAARAKKQGSNISDQAKREALTRPNKPRQAKIKDAVAITTRSVEASGLESRKRKEPSEESTTLTVVPLERKDKPTEQDGSGVRRSNRVTFKPLEFWRNERVILGKSDNTPQPVPIIKGVVRAPPPPEPPVGRGIKRVRGNAQQSTTKAQTKRATRYPNSRNRQVDDGAEADEKDEDHSSDSEVLREQGFIQGSNQQFECVDQATGTIVVRALAESKDAMQFQDVPGGHYQYHRGLEDEDTISSGIVRIPGQGTKPNKNASASSVVYYVIQGTVQVTIYKSTVILHRGGRFLVPQGNQYMIKNLSRK
ncbi:hypothetical protein BGZ72_001217, partial [Mortierella alpina]